MKRAWSTPVTLGILGFAAFVLAGCASIGASRAVGVSVVNLVPTQASMFETSAALTLRLTNETSQPLTFTGSSHRLYLNGTYVGRAVSNDRLSVAPLSTTTQTVTVHLENLTLVRKLAQMSQSSAPVIAYRLESRLHPAEGHHAFGRLSAVATGELDVGALANATGGVR